MWKKKASVQATETQLETPGTGELAVCCDEDNESRGIVQGLKGFALRKITAFKSITPSSVGVRFLAKHPIIRVLFKVLNRVGAAKYIKNKFFCRHKVTEIGDGAYLITEAMLYNSYLFVGTESALLIDTGLGLRGLSETVRGITDKPLIVAVTHSHPGAVGGAGEFECAYVHKKDLKDAARYNRYKLRRLIFRLTPAKLFLGLEEQELSDAMPNFLPLPKSGEFSLGGRTVRVLHTPSQTKGCCCFTDSKTDICVTGAVTLPLSVMVFPRAVTMAVYAESLERLIETVRNCKNYGLLGIKPLSYERTCDLKDLADESVAYGNDYTRLIRLRMSSDRKRAILYFPAKTQRRKFITRLMSAFMY